MILLTLLWLNHNHLLLFAKMSKDNFVMSNECSNRSIVEGEI